MHSTSARLRSTLLIVGLLLPAFAAWTAPCIGHTSGNGTATWFNLLSSTACGDPAPALSDYVTAVATDLWDDSAACGKCMRISGAVGSVVARVVEHCPTCPAGALDLNEVTFEAVVGPSVQGSGSVSWETVPCPAESNVKVKLVDGSNQYFLMIRPRLSRYGIVSVALKPAGTSLYTTMTHANYNAFVMNTSLPAGFAVPISLRLIDVHGQMIQLDNIIPNFTAEIEYTSAVQFPLCDEDAVTDVAMTPGGGLGMLRAAPNPLGNRTILSCSLPSDSVASLAIYDARGRRVRQLFDAAHLSAGAQRFAWDGCDDAGAPLRAGVYFARLDNGREQVGAKLILLR